MKQKEKNLNKEGNLVLKVREDVRQKALPKRKGDVPKTTWALKQFMKWLPVTHGLQKVGTGLC